jgi:periplasmic copper chaperone A
VGPIRSLVAAVVVAGSLAGCAAGLHDETSKERSTPYLGAAAVGGLKVRDVAVIPAASASPSPSTGDTGQTQGSLTMVVVNDGNAPDSITGVQVGVNGGVTPTDPTTSGTVNPGQSLIFGTGATPGSTAPANDLTISGLSSPLVPGTTITVTVTFQTAGQVVVQAPVLSAPGS